jgi:hypothetical protein
VDVVPEVWVDEVWVDDVEVGIGQTADVMVPSIAHISRSKPQYW